MEHPIESLRDKIKQAILWNASFALLRDVVNFAVTLILVRLLSPEDYGKSALVLSVIGFMGVFSFQNFLGHVLQVRQDREVNYQQHCTAGVAIQLALCLATNAVAAILYWTDSYHPVAHFVHILSLVFLFDVPTGLRGKMLERDLDWRRLRLLHLLGMLLARGCALAMAWAGATVHALLYPAFLVSLPFIYDLFVVQRWRPTWQWDHATYRRTWDFGMTRMFSGFTVKGRQLLEAGLFVRLGDFAAFGVFGRAVGLAELFCGRLSFVAMEAIYPALTKVEPGTPGYRRASALVLGCVTGCVIPIAIVLGIAAEAVVNLIYGDKWLAAVALLPWTMAAGAIGAIAHACYMLLLGNQNEKLCWRADLLQLTGTALSLIFLLPRGVQAYLGGLVTTQGITLILLLRYLCRQQAITFAEIRNAIARPVSAGIGALVICRLARQTVNGSDDPTLAVTIVFAIAFGMIYLALLRILFQPMLRELVSYCPGSKHLHRLLLLSA